MNRQEWEQQRDNWNKRIKAFNDKPNVLISELFKSKIGETMCDIKNSDRLEAGSYEEVSQRVEEFMFRYTFKN